MFQQTKLLPFIFKDTSFLKYLRAFLGEFSIKNLKAAKNVVLKTNPINEKEPVPAKLPLSFLLNTHFNMAEHISDCFKM